MKLPDLAGGLAHIANGFLGSERSRDIECYRRLTREKGKIWAPSMSLLSTSYKAEALYKYFSGGNIQTLRHCGFVSAYARRLYFQVRLHEYPNANAYYLLWPLLSNHQGMIAWHSQFQVSHWIPSRKLAECLNPEQYAYFTLQPRLALQKDWANLVERSEAVLLNPPRKHKLYDVDQHFYIALAKGDSIAMEQAIMTIVSPKYNRWRNNEAGWGYEERLFSAWGVLLAKIAYYHGYQLTLDTPWIPNELLNPTPLDNYELPYDFMQAFDIFTPFETSDRDWCDVRLLSPRPMGEQPLTFDEIKQILAA